VTTEVLPVGACRGTCGGTPSPPPPLVRVLLLDCGYSKMLATSRAGVASFVPTVRSVAHSPAVRPTWHDFFLFFLLVQCYRCASRCLPFYCVIVSPFIVFTRVRLFVRRVFRKALKYSARERAFHAYPVRDTDWFR